MATVRAPHHEAYKPHVELGSENGIGDDTAELAILVEADYPSSDGVPMADNPIKLDVMVKTAHALKDWASDKPCVYVGGNMAVYPEEGNPRNYRGPNFFVALDVRPDPPDPDYARWVWRIWKDGKPDFILEVASPYTWEEDAGIKRDDYARWGVTEYWRFNPMPYHKVPLEPLIGERLVDGRYERMRIEEGEAGMVIGRSEILDLDMYVPADLIDGYSRILRLWDRKGQRLIPIREELQAENQRLRRQNEEREAKLQQLRDLLDQKGIEY